MDKKGDYKYGIILYLILGLLVLSISIVFIFQEFWTEDDDDREVCWQSVQLRALMPDSGLGIDELEFKSAHPLKCKTKVVEISESDVEDVKVAQRKIADAMVECWALYGKGDLNAFPSRWFKSSVCVPCARIHLTDEAKASLKGGGKEINIKQALDGRMEQGFSYYSYLQNSGDKFSALTFGNNISFNLEGDGFSIGENSGVGFYNEAELFLDDFNDGLRFNLLGTTGAKERLVSEIDTFPVIDDEIERIAEEMNDIVLSVGMFDVDNGEVDSVFCKGKINAEVCELFEEYAENVSDVVGMKDRGEDNWLVEIKTGSDQVGSGEVELTNRLGMAKVKVDVTTTDIKLPEKFIVGDGDLMINYGVVLTSEEDFGDHIPYLFYFQSGQKDNPYEEVKKPFVRSGLYYYWEKVKGVFSRELNSDKSSFCTYWEGIPA